MLAVPQQPRTGTAAQVFPGNANQIIVSYCHNKRVFVAQKRHQKGYGGYVPPGTVGVYYLHRGYVVARPRIISLGFPDSLDDRQVGLIRMHPKLTQKLWVYLPEEAF